MLSQPATTQLFAPAAHDHFVQFYVDDAALVSNVSRFIRHGIESGSAGVMIATPEHLQQIFAEWDPAFDYRSHLDRGQLVALDADETLSMFMADGWPDPRRFDDVVGNLVRGKLERFGNVVAFGEMVALLFAREQQDAAIRLEHLWNELGAKHRFALHCGYPMACCARADLTDSFKQVCLAHSHVVPVETVAEATSEPQLVRLIAELQQRAAALENEVATRKQAEARLAEREQDLSDFLENGVIALHRVGPDGTILWANQAELDLLGYKSEEYIGRNISKFHVDLPVLEEILCTLTSGGALHDQPARLACKDGSVKHVLISSNAYIREGQFVSTRCFTRDVTDRWMAQEALRERSAILHLAMRSARMGYWVGDLGDRSIRCSEETAEMLGLTQSTDEVSFESFLALIDPRDRADFEEALRVAERSHRMLHCRFHSAARPGHELEVRGEAIYDANGRALKVYGVCSEVVREPVTP